MQVFEPEIGVFTISCGKLIITDPCYGVSENFKVQNVVDKVKNGTWTKKLPEKYDQKFEICVLHKDYKSQQLHWKECRYPCGVDSGLLGVYDFDKFASEKIDLVKNDLTTIDWGMTMSMGGDGTHYMQVGINEESFICGVRHSKTLNYICNNCSKTIRESFYTCKNCISFELCLECINKKIAKRTITLKDHQHSNTENEDESESEDDLVEEFVVNNHDPNTHVFIKCAKNYVSDSEEN